MWDDLTFFCCHNCTIFSWIWIIWITKCVVLSKWCNSTHSSSFTQHYLRNISWIYCLLAKWRRVATTFIRLKPMQYFSLRISKSPYVISTSSTKFERSGIAGILPEMTRRVRKFPIKAQSVYRKWGPPIKWYNFKK